MTKIINRTYFSLFMILLMMVGAFFRLFYIAVGKSYSEVAATQSTLTVTADLPRGTVFDRNNQHLSNNKTVKKAVLTATPKTLTAVYKYFKKTRADEISELLKEGSPIAVEVPNNFECEDAYVFTCYEDDATKNTAVHLLGYLNSDGQGVSGLQQAYNDILYNDKPTVVKFQTDAIGGALLGVGAQIKDNSDIYNRGVFTTLNRVIQEICDRQISTVKGAVAVIKSGTGEIIAMSSSPSFSIDNLSDVLNNPDSPFLNRALEQYNLGSVFKVCIVAAALENGITPDKTYHCNGKVKIGENTFYCHDKEGHGNLNMEDALSKSCNSYFINLAADTGEKKVYDMALKMGFNETFSIYNTHSMKSGLLPDRKTLINPAALANFAIGQGELMATPLTVALMMGSVANGGVYFPPFLITAAKDSKGQIQHFSAQKGRRIMSKNTADIIMNMMKKAVESGTGIGAKPKNVIAAGKTATAETGIINQKGQSVNQTWFVGAVPANKPEYVIAVLAEDGETGSVTAAPVFKRICDEIYY